MKYIDAEVNLRGIDEKYIKEYVNKIVECERRVEEILEEAKGKSSYAQK